MEWTKGKVEELLAVLEDKQRRFAEQYIIDFNGNAAAIRAGYAENSAAQQASRLLNHDNIQLYLQYLISDRAKRTQITADRVVQEIAKIAFHDVSELLDYFDGHVLFKDLDQMQFPEIIKSVTIKEVKLGGERIGKVAKIEVYDKVKALELLGRHTAAFTENLNLTSNGKELQAPQQVVNVTINHRRKGEQLTK